MFNQIFSTFEEKEDDQDTKVVSIKKNNQKNYKPNKGRSLLDPEPDGISANSKSSMGLKKKNKKRKNELTQTRQVELALSISIILSNLSNNDEYIKTLLGVRPGVDG